MPVRKMTRIALLSAILYIAKVVLEFIPNVELISFLTIIYTLVFGTEALLIVTVFNMFELVQWGFGVWWISYLYVWPLLVLATMFIKRMLAMGGFGKDEFVLWAVVSGSFVCCCLVSCSQLLICRLILLMPCRIGLVGCFGTCGMV